MSNEIIRYDENKKNPKNKISRSTELMRKMWFRFLFLPIVLTFPVAFALTLVNRNYDLGKVFVESVQAKPSPETREFHIKLGINYTITVIFGYLCSIGLFQLATRCLSLLEIHEDSKL
jgi:hypothetical protein